MAEVNPQPIPVRNVRVTVPGSVLSNLEEFQRVQASILGEVGCRTCTSGFNFMWQAYSEFAVSSDGEVRPVLADNPQPSPWRSADA
jgi:hypothetical protein